MRLRPRASPRIAGTAAWPSETEDTPATFSTACVRLSGWRDSMSCFGTIVVAVGRGGLDRRRRAGRHDHALLGDRLDLDRHRPVGGDRLDGEGPHVAAAREHDEDLERRHRRRLPGEGPVGAGDLRDVGAEDHDLRADDRTARALQDDAALESEGVSPRLRRDREARAARNRRSRVERRPILVRKRKTRGRDYRGAGSARGAGRSTRWNIPSATQSRSQRKSWSPADALEPPRRGRDGLAERPALRERARNSKAGLGGRAARPRSSCARPPPTSPCAPVGGWSWLSSLTDCR